MPTPIPDDASHPETQQAIDDLRTHADQLSAETDLSKRQAMVLILSHQGLSTTTIADALDLSSPSTVSEHRTTAEDHIDKADHLSALKRFAPIAEGQHLLYKQASSIQWTPAKYGGGPNGEDTATITIYENSYEGEVIWQSESRTIHGNSEMEVNSSVRRYPLDAATGRDASESLLIEETLANPEFDHLAETVAVAKAIDESGLSGGGYCLTRAPHYYGKDYTTADIEDVIISGLIDPLGAAHVLVGEDHDLSVIEEYGDFGDK